MEEGKKKGNKEKENTSVKQILVIWFKKRQLVLLSETIISKGAGY